MEALSIYTIKVTALIALFYLAYHLLLKKETFFSSNRWFLLSGLFTASLLPLLFYTKIVWVTPTAQATTVQAVPIQPTMNVSGTASIPAPDVFTINWLYVIIAIYAVGLLYLLIRFMADLIRIKRMLSVHNAVNKSGYIFIDSDKVNSPFSFFNYIVYNSSLLQSQELQSIIAHEKVHSRQWHSADMLISQLFCIAFWFNPIVWLYKKAMTQNLEFIADAEATKQVEDRVAYQKTLLKITLQPECIAITNHFYQSLIKKRIIMLNKKQSKKSRTLKYAVVLPALAAFVVAFQYKTVAQEKDVALLETAYTQPVAVNNTLENLPDMVTMEINKDVTDQDFKKNKALFKKVFDADVTFTNVKRNSKGEILSIKVAVKDKNHKDNYPVREMLGDFDTPITGFTLGIEKDSETKKNNVFFTDMPQKTITVSNITNEEPALAYLKKSGKGLKRLIIINGIVQDGYEVILPEGQKVKNMTELDRAGGIKKYGSRAKEGAVELTTVDKSTAVTPPDVAIGYDAQDMIIDVGFIVKKDSKDEVLEAYKEALKDEGITMLYDGVVRNSNGQITSIHIRINDKKKNIAEGTWEVQGTTVKPIGDIYVGRKKGLLVVMELK